MIQHRHAKARRLREPYVSRHDRAKYLVVEVFLELCRDLVRQVDAWINHRPQQAKHFEVRVHGAANLFDRIQECA